MHDEATRIAVLRLARRDPRPSNRAIAQAVGISRESVDNILGSGESTVPPVERKSNGTEGNEEPGIGPNTVTNQLAADTGEPGEGMVQLVSAVGDGFTYPAVS